MESLVLDILFIALVFWAGYMWGKRVAVGRIIASIAQDPEHLGRALDEFRAVRKDTAEDDSPVNLVIERHGDSLYLYDLATDEFLAQGSTLEEALNRVAQRYPDRQYSGHLTREQAASLGINN